MHEQLGLDAPIIDRYLAWLRGVLGGDFGRSLISGRPVSEVIARDIGPTLLLMAVALIIIAVLSLAFGTWQGLRPETWSGRLIGAFTVALFSVPSLVVSLLLILVFAVALQALPAGGMSPAGVQPDGFQVARHLVLPLAAVVFGSLLGGSIRVVAAATREAATSKHALAAVMRGLTPAQVVRHHVMRFAVVPLVAQFGASAVLLVEGAYIVEVVFNWPGLGRTAIDAAVFQDHTVLAAVILVTGVIVVAGALIADLVLAVIDPRQRRMQRAAT